MTTDEVELVSDVTRRLQHKIEELVVLGNKYRGKIEEYDKLERYCREKVEELETVGPWTRETLQPIVEVLEAARRPSAVATLDRVQFTNRTFQDRLSYPKIKGSGISSGIVYEIKMLLLTFLRCLAQGGGFRLASNIDGFGKFSDIVVEREGVPGRTCLQLKHKQNECISRGQLFEFKGKFSIITHFMSYRDDVTDKTEHDRFVFYTNADISSECSAESNRDFLTTSDNGCAFVFTEVDGEVYQLLDNMVKYGAFLERVRDSCGANPSEFILGEISGFELAATLPFSETLASLRNDPKRKTVKKLLMDLNMLGDLQSYGTFLDRCQLYCRQAKEDDLKHIIRKELRVLTGVDAIENMLDELVREFDRWWKTSEPCYLTESHEIWTRAVANLFRSLSEARIRKLARYGLKAQEGMVDKYRRNIRGAKIAHVLVDGRCTTLASCIVQQALADTPVIFMSLRDALADRDTVLSAWGGRWGRVLVIEADEPGFKASDFFVSLGEVLKREEERTLVVVTNVNDLKTTNVVRKMEVEPHVEWRDNITLPDLTEETQARVMQAEVTFQGHKVALREMLREHEQLQNQVEDFMLTRLLRRKELRIGDELTSPIYYYIPRTLTREGEFSLRLEDIQERVVIVTGEPGMGKSTLLSHLAREVKKKDPSMWVVRANINEYASYLDQVRQVSAIEFLRAVAVDDKSSQFEQRYFEECWKSRNRMSVLIDGYDEICPEYTGLVNEIFADIIETGIHRIWITSRTLCKDSIEQALNNKCYRLEALNEKDQRSFLTKIWSNTVPEVEDLLLDRFITKILTKFGTSINDRDKLFTGIPLHTFFIADMFQETLKNSNLEDVLFHIDITELYETFFKRKCDIGFRDKMKVDIINAKNKTDFEQFVEENDHVHQLCALFLLLPDQEVQHLDALHQQIRTIIRNLEVGDDVVGIVHSITDGKPVFVHRTVAEYFLAKWFVKNHHQHTSLAERYLLTPSAHMVVDIFNRLMAKGFPLHTSILNGDLERFKQFPLRPGVQDEGGRTPMHLAAGFLPQDTFTKILLPVSDIEIRDTVLKWTALQYADANRNWCNAELLLKKNGSVEDLVYTSKNVQNEEYVKKMLSQCSSEDHTHLLRFLFSLGVSANLEIDPERNRPLHVAARATQDKEDTEMTRATLEVLLRHGGDVNVRTSSGKTPLHFLAQFGHLSIIRGLVERPMDEEDLRECSGTERLFNVLNGKGDKVMSQKVMTQYRDQEGKTAHDLAQDRGLTEVAQYLESTDAALDGFLLRSETHIENPLLLSAVRFLAEERNADVKSRDAFQNTPLHLACLTGDQHVVQYLVEKGAEVSVRNRHGDTPLHGAAHSGSLGVTTYLLERCGMDTDELGCNHRTPLHNACAGGHLDMVRYLLGRGASLQSRNRHGDSVLHQTSFSGRLKVVRYLVEERGQDHGVTGFRLQVPLHCACAGGHLEVVRFLVGMGSAPEVRDGTGNSPLHRSARYGKVGVLRYLMEECGADIAACTLAGYTPLHSACQGGHLEGVKYLVGKGARCETRDVYGNTPLHISAAHGNTPVVQYLVEECGMDLADLNGDRLTPLDRACANKHKDCALYLLERETRSTVLPLYRDSPLHASSYLGKLTAVAYLNEEHMCDVNMQHTNSLTPLHAACDGGHIEVVRYLILNGAKIDACDNYGNTPLHLASIAGKLDVVTHLTEDSRTDLDAMNYDKMSPIHGPCERGHLEVVQVLRRKGANAASRDKNGCTPLHHAAYFGKLNVVAHLIEACQMDIKVLNNDSLTPLHAACMEDHVEVIRYLVRKGADINAPSKNGGPPLHQAAIFGQSRALKFLIQHCGVDPDTPNGDKVTALHEAARAGHVGLVEDLTGLKATIEVGDSNGRTPLHYAASAGKVEVLRHLVKRCRADVNILDDDSMTPLHSACDAGRLEVVRYLREEGAAMDARDKYGDTPLHRAASAGKLDVVTYLVEVCRIDANVLNKHYLTPADRAHAYRQPRVLQYLHSVGGKRYNYEATSP